MADNKIQVLSTEKRTFPPSKAFSEKAHIKSIKEYEQLYKQSVDNPDKFWGEQAEKNLTWFKKMGQGPGLRLPQALYQVVHRRQTQRLGQLPGPLHQHAHAQQGGHHLGSGRR
jgi:hypothetical protein